MSITGVSNNTAAWQTANRQKASASPQQPAATASSAVPSESSYDPFRNLSPTDSITVNLPSGLSIGYMHFGTPLDAAGEAQMADAAADLAGRFSGVTGNGATPTSDGTSAASGIPQDDGARSQGIETDAEQNAITDQLTKTAARLADALKAYMSGSSSQSGTGAAAPGSVASAAAARSLMA
jgi:hypothetical protein